MDPRARGPIDEYESRYPYSPDGKIPVPSTSGMLRAHHNPGVLGRCNEDGASRHRHLPARTTNPVYAAKELSTLDWLSSGRLDLGVGVGWLRKEYEAIGVLRPSGRTGPEECIEVLKTLWCDHVSSFSGETFDLPECSMYPKPVQQPHPPIHFGGESDVAISRAARIGQGWHTFGRLPADVPDVLERLNRELESGRREAGSR